MSKASETVIEISLGNLESNYHYLRSQLKAETKFLAVVKANAYGSAAPDVALHLEQLGVDYFAVAYTTEGMALRKAGVTTPILVLHPLPVHFEEIVEHCLEPALYNQRVLQLFDETALSKGVKDYPVHLKFNTGLNRLGFGVKDIADMGNYLQNTKALKVASVFSHLAASEDLSLAEFSQEQINSFEKLFNMLLPYLGHTPWRHMLNTSGILNYAAQAQYEMVRSGIGLYGFGNDPAYEDQLKPVVTLKSVISQIHHIEAGESVGYNRGYLATEDRVTATIPLGHADGIGRIYGKGKGFITVHGMRAPIIGNVCMDMLMIDVTGIPCEEGDEVVVFGEDPTAAEFAATAGTISYELITALASRIKRVLVK